MTPRAWSSSTSCVCSVNHTETPFLWSLYIVSGDLSAHQGSRQWPVPRHIQAIFQRDLQYHHPTDPDSFAIHDSIT